MPNMKLARDIARCDGLLPKETLLNGKPQVLWSIDCPQRERCVRFLAHMTDIETSQTLPVSFVAVAHAPDEECRVFKPV
jgi:hypothetical protein